MPNETVEPLIALLMQGGALALLAYLVIWATKTGAPRLFDALMAMQNALLVNTKALENLEQRSQKLSDRLEALYNKIEEQSR